MDKKILIFFQGLLITFLLTTCNPEDDEPSTPIVPEFEFEITDFSPKEGIEGTEITINGNNFGRNLQDVQITVNDVVTTISEISNSQIKVIAPENNRGVDAEVKVTIQSKVKTFSDVFSYLIPVIEDISPKISVLFKDISITGRFFSNNPDDIEVIINDKSFPVISSTLSTIVFQTNRRDLDLRMNDFPVSVKIGESIVTSTEKFTFGAQFKVNDDLVNNNYKNNIPLCPGSAININIDDNRIAGNLQGSTIFIEDPMFFIGSIQTPVLFNTPNEIGGRDWYINIPTNIELGMTKISVLVNDKNLIVEQNDSFEIGKGSFKILGSPENFAGIEIELSHIFRQPRDMIVKYTNTQDNSVVDGSIKFDSFSDDFTKTKLRVAKPDIPGSYRVSVFTPDGFYELESTDNDLFEFL